MLRHFLVIHKLIGAKDLMDLTEQVLGLSHTGPVICCVPVQVSQ